jgi:hypothetical protein
MLEGDKEHEIDVGGAKSRAGAWLPRWQEPSSMPTKGKSRVRMLAWSAP